MGSDSPWLCSRSSDGMQPKTVTHALILCVCKSDLIANGEGIKGTLFVLMLNVCVAI